MFKTRDLVATPAFASALLKAGSRPCRSVVRRLGPPESPEQGPFNNSGGLQPILQRDCRFTLERLRSPIARLRAAHPKHRRVGRKPLQVPDLGGGNLRALAAATTPAKQQYRAFALALEAVFAAGQHMVEVSLSRGVFRERRLAEFLGQLAAVGLQKAHRGVVEGTAASG